MVTKINGTTGVDKIQNGVVTLDNLTTSANSSLTDSTAFRVYRSSNQSLSAGNRIGWDVAPHDTESAFNTSNGQYTIPKTGYWFFHLTITSGSAQSASAYFYLSVNGARTRDIMENLSWGTNTERNGSSLLYCTQGEVIETILQGASFTVQGGNDNFYSYWQGFYLGN